MSQQESWHLNAGNKRSKWPVRSAEVTALAKKSRGQVLEEKGQKWPRAVAETARMVLVSQFFCGVLV